MHKRLLIILMIVFLLIDIPMKVNAENTDINNRKINYKVIIEDDANLLTEEEEKKLKECMTDLTEYGNVLFKTTNSANGTNSLRFIQNYYYSILNNKSGVAFYIDMYSRQVCACATGGLDSIVTNSKCDTIMDNVYTYAKKRNYYKCAEETFTEIKDLLEGRKIAEKMKYYCNAIVAIMISLFSTYGIFILYTTVLNNKKASDIELLAETKVTLDYTPINANKTGSHSVYSPVSDGGSSSGGGFSGGGGGFSGGGGGGFSGSGGSHGF